MMVNISSSYYSTYPISTHDSALVHQPTSARTILQQLYPYYIILGLGFEKFEYNLYLSIIGNLPLGVPYAMSFKRYHHDHHLYQGVVGVDTDIGTRIEALLIQSKWTKFIHIFFMVFFYSLRPIFVAPKRLTSYEWMNNIVVIGFMATIYYLSGTWLAPFYFLGSSFFGLGPHPLSGHFISEVSLSV